MFQNIKVDIIYYKTNTDFEMEFNLCGCCRMRLLTDKSPEQKNLVHNLARAVSRSRVIIITGKLFGEDGIINVVARSISKDLSIIDNKLYGISSENEIEIIKGATPLVTRDGCFGGCIIESGPQTMILLSENKDLRKTVMNTLIHPYIEELCAIELKNKAEAESGITAVVEENDAEAQTDISEEINDDVSDETEEEIVEPTSDLEIEETEPQDTENSFEENYDSQDTSKTDEDIRTENTILQNDDELDIISNSSYEDDTNLFYSPDDPDADEYDDEDEIGILEDIKSDISRTASNMLKDLPLLIVSIILFLLIAVLAYCIFYIPSKNGVSPTANLQEIFDTLAGR